MALLVRLKFDESPRGYITVLNTHLEDKTTPDCRRRQMSAILETLKAVNDPVDLIEAEVGTRSRLPVSASFMEANFRYERLALPTTSSAL